MDTRGSAAEAVPKIRHPADTEFPPLQAEELDSTDAITDVSINKITTAGAFLLREARTMKQPLVLSLAVSR